MTDTATHTPGPWTVNDVSIESEGGLIALAYKRGKGSMKANARLIAAAPELLDALKYARRFLRGPDHDVDYVDGIIAKAEGRQDD
ncbi:hypothetical protein ACVQH5_29455 [Klebsiella pneumoniae]